MRSNVGLRSNVFPLDHPEFPELLFQTRGRSALRIQLGRKAPSLREAEGSALLKLKPRQLAELAWEIPCSRCGAMPEGPVLRHGSETVEFRCPLGVCEHTEFRAVLVNLDLDMVNQGLSRYGNNVTAMVLDALADFPPGSWPGLDDAEDPVRLHPFTVRLTRTQYYQYGGLGIPHFSKIANAGLRKMIRRQSR